MLSKINFPFYFKSGILYIKIAMLKGKRVNGKVGEFSESRKPDSSLHSE
jgi:hypothetical protein